MKKRVCFLYIDEPYNIFHSLSLAIQLNQSSVVDVEILATPRNVVFLESFPDFITGLKITCIRPHWYISLPHLIEIKLQFRTSLFLKYRTILQSFDGIICSLYNDAELRLRLNHVDMPKLIFVGHGIANRSYSYKDEITTFDYILLAGNKEKKERERRGQLSIDNHLMTGYIKYEICRSLPTESPFAEGEFVVLYNPHWLKDYSSFYKFGFDILDYFANQDRYKLIFAPHQLLTVRNKSILNRLKQYTHAESIHIDLNSSKLSDMTYTKMADLYLGDISSQALEFILHKKRPCVLLKSSSNSILEGETFHSWQSGAVLDELGDITKLITDAIEMFKSTYYERQQLLVDEIFYTEDRQPSTIAADGVLNYLNKNS